MNKPVNASVNDANSKKLINSYIKNLLQQKSNQNKKLEFFFFLDSNHSPKSGYHGNGRPCIKFFPPESYCQ